MVDILSDEIQTKFHLKAIYVKVKCLACGDTFGITAFDNLIPEGKLVCRKCAIEKQLMEISKQKFNFIKIKRS